MSFLDQIFARLEASGDQTLLTELREAGPGAVTGHDLLARIAQARAFLSARGLKKGDRIALLAANGVEWVAMDLAIMAEGLVVVPLYSRQAPAELVAMMKDCSPAAICCGDATLRDSILQNWSQAPAIGEAKIRWRRPRHTRMPTPTWLPSSTPRELRARPRE
jgi:long-chain acyl-CoA synthetase